MKNFEKAVTIEAHDKLFSNKFFQEGRKMAQEGTVPVQVHKGCWVKKMVSPADWTSWFSHNNTYVKLSEEKRGQVVLGVWIGFLTGMPGGASGTCPDMNDDEKYIVYQSYKRNNVGPLPKLPANYKPSVDARGYQFTERSQPKTEDDIDVSKIPF